MTKKQDEIISSSPQKKASKLLIVESPAKIKTLSKFLGDTFAIAATFGHVKDLPESKIGVTLNDKTKKVELEYEVLKEKAGKIAEICKLAGRATDVYLASDPDREGEIISWHIAQEITKVMKDPSRLHRITFNEITKSAVIKSIENPGSINENMVSAQQARRVLDRWVGYEVSPILWKKITKGLSAGRVQSVALLLICKRDEEINAFKPEESWSIHALFKTEDGKIEADLFKISGKTAKLATKEQADAALKGIKDERFKISDIIEKERLKNPLPPFMTSTLQQDAYNKLGFSVDKTMMIAQKLYEGIPLTQKDTPEALITYMRTDSLRIADSAIEQVRGFIGKEYGDKYLPKKSINYGKEGAQDAHEAVRPVDVTILPSTVARYATAEQAKLYELIWKRFVACQMSQALYFQRQVLIEGGKYLFKATGSTLIFDGFLKVYSPEEDEEEAVVTIPKNIAKDNPLGLMPPTSKQHFTQPPPRYTEGSLVKEMEKCGIGRPSTYAATLSTIQKRAYVEKDKKRFAPTELGKAVNDLLCKSFPDIINIAFTARMEEDLDKIAEGKSDRDKVLTDFYKKFKEDLAACGQSSTGKTPIPTDLHCPDCKQDLVIRFGKSGEFIGCVGFPTCKFTSNFTRNSEGKIEFAAATAPAETGLTCPKCKKPLISRIGKFGPFLSCSGYPTCKYIHQEKLNMPCPQCKGNVIKRKWRGGSFWGCSGYPECKFAIFGEVAEEACPNGDSIYLLVTKDKEGNRKASCPIKTCNFTKPIDQE